MTLETISTSDIINPSPLGLAPQGDSILRVLFFDENNQPLLVSGTLFDISTNEVNSTIANSYEADITLNVIPSYQLGVEFSAPGYKTIKTTVAELQAKASAGTVNLVFQKGIGLMVIYTGAAIALLLLLLRSEKKNVGAFDKQKAIGITEVVLIGIAGLLALNLIKKILDFLGITKSAATINLDNASNNPSSFWSPQYYLDLLSKGVQWSAGIDTTTAGNWLQEISDAMSFFGDNESKIIGILKRCPTQATLSFLAWEYNYRTGEDFLSWLRGKSAFYPWAGLSDSDLYDVSQYISKLPKY